MKAEFIYMDKGNRGFPKAYYNANGEVYPNVFPCEMVMRNRIYKKGKNVSVWLLPKMCVVFDGNAVALVIVSFLFCVPAGAYSVYLAASYFAVA